MNLELSEVSRDSSGWQQTVTYEHDGRTRREIFVGRTPDELGNAVRERVRELRRSNGKDEQAKASTQSEGIASTSNGSQCR
jgi:hypothetical protein